MAIILILICSGLGFTSALAALLLFDASMLQAMGIWMGGGFAALLLAAFPLLLPKRQRFGDPRTESV